MKELKNGTFKYKGVTVAPTPLGKYPDMVTVIKTTTKSKSLRGKKFINLHKTKIAIETTFAEKLIAGGAGSVEKQLESLGKTKI